MPGRCPRESRGLRRSWEPQPAASRQQEQGVSGERAVVGDAAPADHRLHLRAAEPLAAQVLLLELQFRGAGGQAGGDENVEALAGQAVRAMQMPEVAQDAGGQAGLLAEFFPGEVLRVVGDGHAGKRALRELPAPHPHRVAVLLHQVESAILDRDDQREVRLLYVGVCSGRPVRAADAVLPQPHMPRLVYHPGGCLLDHRPAALWHPNAPSRYAFWHAKRPSCQVAADQAGQENPVAASTSAGRGRPSCAPRRVVAAAPAAQAAVTAAAGSTPLASATASAPTNASPAPTVSTAVTAKPGTTAVPGGPASTAPAAPSVTTT